MFLFFQLHGRTQNRGDQENVKPNMETVLHFCEVAVQWRLRPVNVTIGCLCVCSQSCSDIVTVYVFVCLLHDWSVSMCVCLYVSECG